MNLIFISNRFTNHQVELCNEFFKIADNFLFVEVERRESRALEHGKSIEGEVPSYVITSDNLPMIQNNIDNADIVIIGSAPDYLVNSRLKRGLLTFKYSERMYKKGIPWLELPLRYFKNFMRFNRYHNYYLLCASAYSAYDYSLSHSFVGKAFKWGYFPKTTNLTFGEISKKKAWDTKLHILWVGRFIDWKHPEKALDVALDLSSQGIDYTLTMLGTGTMEEEIKESVESMNLQGNVKVLGSVPSNDVREFMDRSHIFLYTSDYNEGWGAVLNEAMASGCIVIASHAIGAAPYLVKNGVNGFLYNNDEQQALLKCVHDVLSKRNQWNDISKCAYNTIRFVWNAGNAAKCFMEIARSLYCDHQVIFKKSGPCSKAESISNNWFSKL